MCIRRQALFRYLSGGPGEVARLAPRVESEDSCHEDHGREGDQCAPCRRFECVASGATGFVLAGHELDSCTVLGSGLKIPNRDPGKYGVLSTGSIAGRSALSRWYRGSLGLVLRYRSFRLGKESRQNSVDDTHIVAGENVREECVQRLRDAPMRAASFSWLTFEMLSSTARTMCIR